MTIEVDVELYEETTHKWAEAARKDLDEAIVGVDTALKYVTDGLHKAQLKAARASLVKAQSALSWVKP